MSGRPHNERLLSELREIRAELEGEIRRFGPEDWDWAPGPEMKTSAVARDRRHGEGLQPLGYRARVRQVTARYLERCTEESLQAPIAVPEEWRQYWGDAIEPEEAFRWIGRHEYYHLGQIIIYRWLRGDNPYKRG